MREVSYEIEIENLKLHIEQCEALLVVLKDLSIESPEELINDVEGKIRCAEIAVNLNMKFTTIRSHGISIQQKIAEMNQFIKSQDSRNDVMKFLNSESEAVSQILSVGCLSMFDSTNKNEELEDVPTKLKEGKGTIKR